MIRVFAPAKINLHLDILRRRDDGYHDLSTIFQAIDWGDELRAELAIDQSADSLIVSGNPVASAGVPSDDRNIVLKTMARLRESHPELPPLRLHLFKRVPAQAGLGGGSSDAVAALVAASELGNLGLSADELERTAALVGSDTCFFVRGGTQVGEGRGEILRPVSRRVNFSILLVVPSATVSTPEAFRSLAPTMLGARSDQAELLRALASSRIQGWPVARNTFQDPVAGLVPSVAATLAALESTNPLCAMMSGSGSACFAVYRDPVEAQTAKNRVETELGACLRACVVARPVEDGVRILRGGTFPDSSLS